MKLRSVGFGVKRSVEGSWVQAIVGWAGLRSGRVGLLS